MDIFYDHAAGRAKVVVTEGLNAGKTFLRLYGLKKEYMIRTGEYPTCRRSYLGERRASSGKAICRSICGKVVTSVLYRSDLHETTCVV